MLRSAGCLAASMLLSVGLSAPAAHSGSVYENCTSFNKKYPHGVGRNDAKNQTSGTPVTTFKRSTKLYKKTMNANAGLDGDKDGIACEKA